jgi:glycosyltransferase involved in cell wall biosynthesis
MKKVLVVQRRLTHYRVSFFEVLKKVMYERNIELILAYGDPDSEEMKKKDEGEISWAKKLKTHYLLKGKVCWQPFSNLVNEVDAIVITHENKLIFNLIPQWFYKNKKIILWGHGENLQKLNPDWRDSFKRVTANKADWWLAYTDMSIPLIQKSGFPNNRITVLNNTIDTHSFRNDLLNVTNQKTAEIRLKYDISGHSIGIFIGSLYEEKRIDFLLESALLIKKNLPDFELIIAGDGKLRAFVEQQSFLYPWIHYVGAIKGIDKATLLSISKIMLNPGLVGLGILDSFLSHTPMITTDCGVHSPEVVYLSHMNNGIMTKNDLEEYSETIIEVLLDSSLLDKLCEGCKAAGAQYTLDNMAINFTNGVLAALDHSFYRFSQ